MRRPGESLTNLKQAFQHSGVPHTLISDNAKVFTTTATKQYLTNMVVDAKYIEPHNQTRTSLNVAAEQSSHGLLTYYY